MKNFKISLIVLLLAGLLAACASGTTITGNPPDKPLPSQPVGVDGGDDNGGGVTINKAAFTKAALAANPLWKDDAPATNHGSTTKDDPIKEDNPNEESTAEYFVEFPREGNVNIYPTDDREYFSFKYIVRLDGSVASVADDKGIGLIGSLNEDMTALNLWLISKDGTVVATLTSDITEEDKAFFDFLLGSFEDPKKECMETTVEKVGTVSDNIPSKVIKNDAKAYEAIKNAKDADPKVVVPLSPFKYLY